MDNIHCNRCGRFISHQESDLPQKCPTEGCGYVLEPGNLVTVSWATVLCARLQWDMLQAIYKTEDERLFQALREASSHA
jgi:hypothetical protein